ncbi:hypothetical protein ACFL49_01875 [Candidatus Omnitrophota bacterium]
MKTCVLLLLRLYGMTLGRFSFFAKQLKKMMVYFLVWRAPKKYVASTKYFDHKEFIKKKEDVA